MSGLIDPAPEPAQDGSSAELDALDEFDRALRKAVEVLSADEPPAGGAGPRKETAARR